MTRHAIRSSARAGLAGLVVLVMACTPPPAAPAPSSGAAPAGPTPATSAPQATAAPAAKPTTTLAAAATTGPTSAPTTAAAAKPTAAAGTAAAPVGQAPSNCKAAQVYNGATSDKGWSWSHEQAFLAVKKALPYVDLSIRKDGVPDDKKQALEDLLESMVQQGARLVFSTSFGFMEPTRAVAKRHADVAFFHASGFPGRDDPPNIAYYFATIEEARYISGEIAGLAVEPGAHIGYVSAHPIPEVFRGENAFALGVMQTNPTAKVYNKWTLTWFDPNLERQAAESLLEPPINAALLSQHQDSPATQLAAEAAGKLGIAYDADMNDKAPKATLTAPIWNWAVHNEYAIRGVCLGTWMLAGKANIPFDFKYWMGSFQDGTVQLAPLNTAALASHPRKEQIQRLYNDEVAAFKAGRKSFETIFTGPIKDNEGQVRIAGKPEIGALYDERAQWFVENVVGSTTP